MKQKDTKEGFVVMSGNYGINVNVTNDIQNYWVYANETKHNFTFTDGTIKENINKIVEQINK